LAPVLHFVLIGAAAFWLLGRPPIASRTAVEEPIVVTAGDVERLRQEWSAQFGASAEVPPDAALIDAAIEEEILYREAITRGFDRQTAVVRDRLARLAQFVDADLPEDAEVLEAAARRLGLERHDVVIRRHLVHAMRLALAAPVPADRPTDSALAAYYAQHAGAFAQPARLRFTHVYVSGERHGSHAEAEAQRLLGELRRRNIPPQDGGVFGEPFIRGPQIGPLSARGIDRFFGGGFAAALDGLTPGIWSGPVASTYGWHLVLIRERLPGGVPPLTAVYTQVLHRYLRDRGTQRLRERLQALRARYQVTVESSSPERSASGAGM
jgi:hypothetical protein